MHLMRLGTGDVHLVLVNNSDLLGGRAGLNRDFADDVSLFQVDNQDVVAGTWGVKVW